MTAQPPALELADWKPTRDTLHQYARIIGKIRGQYMPKSKHWWHITLAVTARGLTTTPFPIAGQNVELALDMVAHRLVVDSSDGWSATLPLPGQSTAGLCRWLSATFAAADIDMAAGLLAAFDSEEEQAYDVHAIGRFRQAINWVDAAFKTVKGGLREETGPVQVFPHHMDLSMSWFSGRLVAGVDPADEERADEQLNFGFVTGDGSVSDAYFYATAYPTPAGWTDLQLPAGAHWHTEGWTGAVLPYAALAATDRPQELLLAFLVGLRDHGALCCRRGAELTSAGPGASPEETASTGMRDEEHP